MCRMKTVVYGCVVGIFEDVKGDSTHTLVVSWYLNWRCLACSCVQSQWAQVVDQMVWDYGAEGRTKVDQQPPDSCTLAVQVDAWRAVAKASPVDPFGQYCQHPEPMTCCWKDLLSSCSSLWSQMCLTQQQIPSHSCCGEEPPVV